MEALFAHTYLILFGKLATGGLLALAIPPFFALERGFYRSTAVVYLMLAALMLGGEAYLYNRYGSLGPVSASSLALWGLFLVLFSAYTFTLFIELPPLRARLYPAAVACGLLALTATGSGFVPNGASTLATLPFAACFAVGAAVTGAALTGMLLGHWYLIETGLELTPLHRMLAFCRGCLRLQVVLVPLVILVLWAWPASPWADGLSAAFGERFYLLVLGRICAWILALVLLSLIGRTLAIPQTMAATGLFYIQSLTVAVGEILGHWLLFRTGLPF